MEMEKNHTPNGTSRSEDFKGKKDTKDKIPFDGVFDIVGSYGRYQFFISCLLFFLAIFSVESIYMNFVGYTQEHWCFVPELENLPHDVQKNVAIPKDSDGDYETCDMYNLNYTEFSESDFINWDRSLYNQSETIKCADGWVYDLEIYELSAVNEWDIVCGKTWQIDLVTTLQLVGFLFGSLLAGTVSDRYGRKLALLLQMTIKCIGCIISTWAPHYAVLLVGRFILGLGAIGAYIVAFVLLVELSGSNHTSWLGMVYSAFFSIGFMVVPGFAYAVRDFRLLQIIMTVPPIVMTVAFIFLLPESPRWLLLNNKVEAGDELLRKMARINGKVYPDDFHASQVDMGSGDEEKKEEDEDEDRKTCIDLLRTPVMRRRSIMVFIIWFTVNLVYYALSLNAGSLAGDIFLNTFLLGAVEIPANFIALVFMNAKRFGRRVTMAMSLLIAGVGSLIAVPLLLTVGESTATTVLAMIGKAGATAAFNGMYVYTAELFPTEVRNVGLGASSMTARFSGIVAPYVGGSLGDLWAPLPSLIFGITGTLSGILTFFLPETLNKKLPETIEEVEHGAKYKQTTPSLDMEVSEPSKGVENKGFNEEYTAL